MAVEESPRGQARRRHLLREEPLGETLDRLARACCDDTGAAAGSLALLAGGAPSASVHTDALATALDAAQYDAGEGPGPDAYRSAATIAVDEPASDPRWPAFAAEAGRHLVGSVLALPLIPGDEVIGALCLYFAEPGPVPAARTAAGEAVAGDAAIVVANARVYRDALDLIANLRRGLESRATIDIAIGVLMAANGRPPEENFQLLVRASQRDNRKLRDIAVDIVTRAQRRT